MSADLPKKNLSHAVADVKAALRHMVEVGESPEAGPVLTLPEAFVEIEEYISMLKEDQ
jgi:hypothetical protein